jgi:hypothetical protein
MNIKTWVGWFSGSPWTASVIEVLAALVVA